MAPDAEIIELHRQTERRAAYGPDFVASSPPLRRAAGDGGWWAYPATDAVIAHPSGTALVEHGDHPGGAVRGLVGSYPTPDHVRRSTVRPHGRPSPAVLRRRRAVLLAAVAVTLLVLLALPIQAFAGRSVPRGGVDHGAGPAGVAAVAPGSATP